MKRDFQFDVVDFINAPDGFAGYPVDAMHESLSHAKAIVFLLSQQFSEDVEEQISDRCVSAALDAVRGQLNILEKLIDTGAAIPPVKPASNG